jgi:hypothetical protein
MHRRRPVERPSLTQPGPAQQQTGGVKHFDASAVHAGIERQDVATLT